MEGFKEIEVDASELIICRVPKTYSMVDYRIDSVVDQAGELMEKYENMFEINSEGLLKLKAATPSPETCYIQINAFNGFKWS